ncbi:MAG TPA: lysylphosphatidylglycerol synthase domain-containing protein [Anaerolineales bacterium]|nr:lysylphosphatidylglycerol synthase domain-containing protein [Anaerolineales bacterium]
MNSLQHEGVKRDAKRGILPGLARLLILLAALAPLSYAMAKSWRDVRAALTHVNWSDFVLAQFLLFLVMPLMASISWFTVRRLTGVIGPYQAIRLYFISQLPKYLPGGIWAFPGRMLAYQRVGVDRIKSIVSVFREVTALFLGGATIALLGLSQGLPASGDLRLLLGIGIAGSILVLLLTQLPWFWRLLSSIRVLRSTALPMLEIPDQDVSLVWLPSAFVVSCVFWLALGASFRQLVLAINPSVSLSWIGAASLFSLAWCVGFVVVFVPAGLGIREAALAFLLSRFLPEGDALAVALLARLWWMGAEALWILPSWLWTLGRWGEQTR